MPSPHKVLVTGGLGYLGRHVVRALLGAGREVVILDHSDREASASPRCRVVRDDFRRVGDHPDVLKDSACVVHLAWSSVPATSAQDPVADVQDNVAGTVGLLEACVRHGVPKIVFSSSGGTVYGRHQYLPIDEVHPTRPANLHGAMKRSVEAYLDAWYETRGLDYTALRIGNLYGPFQRYRTRFGAVSTFIRQVVREEEIEIWGDGKVIRDYVFVDDVVSAVVAAVEQTFEEKVFNVGTGRGCDLNELVAIIERAAGRKAKVRHESPRGIDVPASVLDARLLRRRSGWQPRTTLEEGIRAILENEFHKPVSQARVIG